MDFERHWRFVGLVFVSWYREDVFGVMVVALLEVVEGMSRCGSRCEAVVGVWRG